MYTGSAPITVFDLRAYNPHARLSSLPALEAGVLFVRLPTHHPCLFVWKHS